MDKVQILFWIAVVLIMLAFFLAVIATAPEEPEQTIELNGKKYKLVEV